MMMTMMMFLSHRNCVLNLLQLALALELEQVQLVLVLVLVLELEIPTAELSWLKAWRSGGTASATPMANTTQAAARAGRSSPYRQSRGCRS